MNGLNEINIYRMYIHLTTTHIVLLVVINAIISLMTIAASVYALYYRGALRVFCFSTFFYTKLAEHHVYTYKNVSRWSKREKIVLADCDRILLPVHVGNNHWCCACINVAKKRFEYYDSLGGTNQACLQHLKQFMKDEYNTYGGGKRFNEKEGGEKFDVETWNTSYKSSSLVPRQNNGSVQNSTHFVNISDAVCLFSCAILFLVVFM